jgi:hypothetical protein
VDAQVAQLGIGRQLLVYQLGCRQREQDLATVATSE